MYLPKFRLLRAEVGVYLVYAGLGRRFFDTFRAERKIFLQLPAFGASADTFDDDASIIRHLHMSKAWNRYLVGSTSTPPSRNARAFSAVVPNARSKEGRAFINDLASTKLMFATMQPGDIILVTPEGHYKELLIGEIASAWQPDQVTELQRFRNESTPHREVKWLNIALSRRDFPLAVAKRLQNRRAITRVDDDLYNAIFRIIYPSFIWGNESKLDIYAPSYSGHDPLQTFDAAFIIKWALSAYAAFVKDEFSEFQDLPLGQAVEIYFDPSYVEAFSQEFNSPGSYKLVGAGGGVALAVAALVALATSEEHTPAAQVQQEISVEVQGVHVPSESDLNAQQIGDLVSSLRADTTNTLRTGHGRSARNQLGLTLDNREEVRRARDRLAQN